MPDDNKNPRGRSSYNLEELLSQGDYSQPLSEEDKEWMNAPAIGREILPPYEPNRDVLRFTMELERSVYVRAAMEQLNFEKLLTDAIEAELKRLDAERPKITKEEIDAYIEEHSELLKALADR